MELVVGLIIIALVWWGLSKLADFFEERHFLLWLICYIAAGALTIMVLAAARSVR